MCMYNIVNGTAPKNIILSQQTRTDTLITFLFPGLEIIYLNKVIFSGGTIWNNLVFCFKPINGKSTFKQALKNTIHRSWGPVLILIYLFIFLSLLLWRFHNVVICVCVIDFWCLFSFVGRARCKKNSLRPYSIHPQ